MKKLVAMAMVALAAVAFADTETVDGITWTYTGHVECDGTYIWASVGDDWGTPAIPKSTVGAITVPSKLGGYNVTRIGPFAFEGCSGLTNVTIPDSVTSIGDYAFEGCSGLASVTIGNGYIGEHAFEGCSGLTNVTIENGYIGDGAFSGCNGLTNVTIGNGDIGNGAFSGCSGLTSMTIGNGVTSIGDYAIQFQDCSGLMSFIVGDNNANYKSINGLLLSKDGKRLIHGVIGDVTIPDSVTSIEDSAFYGCSGLTSVTIPDSVTSIGPYAFFDCSGLTSVTIPDGVTSIEYGAFSSCSGLTSVTIPDSVTSIGNDAFYGCSGLTSVTIPGSVTSIKGDAFSSCSGLTNITFEGNAPKMGDYSFEDFFRGAASDCCAYVRRDSTGWGVDIPGTWQGIRIDYYDPPSPVSNVQARQRYPWNGLVDIDYTITGDTTGLNLSFSARDAETGETYTPKTFLSAPSSVAGTNRATWNPKADGYSIVSTNIVVTVLLTRTVVPPEPTGEHDMVQLWKGGPYWATTNIGAEEPWDSGYYFWWGDTVGYTRSGGTLDGDYYSGVTWVSSAGQQMSSSPFSSSSCPTYDKYNAALQSEGWIDSTTNLVAVHDAAHVHWGGNWRMPTSVEIQALVDNCTTTWITTNGVPGRLVTGKGAYANRSIFLPAVGLGSGSYLCYTGSDGYCWSSTPYSDDSSCAWRLDFFSSYLARNYNYRYFGQSVRPVQTSVTITFDANGGAVSSSSRSYAANGTYGSLPTATREGYFFAGWFTAASGGTRVTADSTVPASAMTLCAHWEKVPDKVQLWEGGPYWATTNIGAEKPEDYGYYFWWGDTLGYKRVGDAWVASDGSSSNFSFGSGNTPTYNKDVATLQSEGWITADGVLTQAYDAAHVQWGGNWRMPTDGELSALNNNCDWTWTTTNSVNGYIVRGKGNYASASIFLPAAGYGGEASLRNASSYGYYWSSVPSSGNGRSWRLYFYSSDLSTDDYGGRSYAFAVRPVQGFTEAQVSVVVPVGDSAPFSIDTRTGVRESAGDEMFTYSSLWDGDADATVTIAQDGVTIAEGLTGEDTYSWSVQKAGTYVLTHTTYTNGVAGKVESATFNVAAKDISLAQVVVDCGDVTYSGAAHTPAIQSVTFGERSLAEGTDYTLSYSDNVDAGTATITLTGTNLYNGTYTTNFTIRPRALTQGMVEAIGNHPYTGKAQTPKPVVTDAELGMTLREDVEYTLSYANNTAIGDGIVTVTGKGNYTGSIARTFVIEPSAGSELEESLGGAGKAESDGKGGWIVTITNDVDAANLPIEIPDDLGNVTIDLNGHDLIGGEGQPAIIIVPGHDEGGPTQLTIATSGGDAIVQGGEGAPAVEVAEGAQDGVIINIGEGVAVQGGGVPAIDGTIGENNGTLVKVEVPVPAIASKVYTGELLTADVSPTDLYAVTNDGGVDVGNYPVTLTLIDAANYRWKDGDSEPIELTFTITKRPVAVVVVGHTATYTYDSTEKSVAGYDATTEDELYDIAADTSFRGGIIDAALPSVARTDVGVTMMGLTVADFANNNANFDVFYAVMDGWIKITTTKELDELVESFDGLPVEIEPDGEGGWTVTITNDIDVADLPIEIPDNIGPVTIDLNGHDLIGCDGESAIRIVPGEGEGEPTVISIVDSGEDAAVIGGEGAPAIEVAEGAQEGVLVNIGEGVTVEGGDDYTPAIIGDVGTNEGTIVEPTRIHIPGEGTVTTPKSWKVGQKVTWKAKAAKGSVFAHWEGELVDSLGLSRNELRNPSLAFTVPKGFDANQISAVFISIDDDGLSELSFVDGEGEAMDDEDGILLAVGEPVEFWLADDSRSYVKATVSGLPSGLKFDAKTMKVAGTPKKSGAYWVLVKAKNASGYQWAEKVRMAVSGYTTEPKEPKLTRTAYYPLTVISSDAAAGTVSGTGVYAEGKKASISAKPVKGRVFAGWYRDAALTKPMRFASGDYRKSSQSVIIPEVRYLFAKFVAATTAGDPIIGLAAKGSGLVAESSFKWRVGVAVPEGDGVEYASASLPSASAAKLPSGVKFDAAKSCFTGVPTKAGRYEATVSVKNASKSTDVLKLTIEVAALDEWAQGTFNGEVAGGLVTLTVDGKGKISGKILEGGKTWTLSAPSFSRAEPLAQLEPPENLAYYATVIAKSGKVVATNEIAIVAEATGVADARPYRGVATGTFELSNSQTFELSAWQNLWKVEPWKTDIKDYAKANPTKTEEVEGGTITLKFASSGAVTAKGEFIVGYDEKKQRDIVYSSSCSTVVIPEAGGYMVYLYFPANAKKNFDGYSGVVTVTAAIP